MFDDPYPTGHVVQWGVNKVLALALLASTALLLLTVYLNNTSLSCHKELPRVQHPVQKGVLIYQPLYSAPSINHLYKIMPFIFLVQLSVVRYPALNRILTSDYSLKGLSNGVFKLAIALIYNVSNFPRPSLLGWLQEHEASHAVHEWQSTNVHSGLALGRLQQVSYHRL